MSINHLIDILLMTQIMQFPDDKEDLGPLETYCK
jgi:hypothetical protein